MEYGRGSAVYGVAVVALDGVVTVVAVFVVSVAAVDGVDVDVVAGGPWWVVVFGHPNSGARGDARNLVATTTMAKRSP